MKNLFVLLVTVLLLAVAQNTNAQDELYGAWIADMSESTQGDYNQAEISFNNGDYTMSLDGVLASRGTYSVNGGRYRLQTVYVWGSIFSDLEFPLESRWYTHSQLRTALRPSLTILTMEAFNALVDSVFLPETGIYTVRGDILTMRDDAETETVTYRRR